MAVPETAKNTAKRIFKWLKNLRYRFSGGGGPAGSFSYQFADDGAEGSLPVVLWLRGDRHDAPGRDEVQSWIARQTLPELVAIAVDRNGSEMWRIAAAGGSDAPPTPTWFIAPGALPEVPAAYLESSLLVAAAEDVDAVITVDHDLADGERTLRVPDHDHTEPLRSHALYRADSYSWHCGTDRVEPRRPDRVIKLVNPTREVSTRPAAATFHRRRRGPYVSSADLEENLRVSVRDASLLTRRRIESQRPAVLVTVPFLARGGAEQTLLATLQHLTDRFEFSIATLAPHREEIGDRRDDFRAVTERIYCLGDLVHPDVMVGIIQSILDSTGADILYNANGTTLFYDFAPRLKQARPDLRIIDHLYDHEVGYIDRYDMDLLASVDACVAENHVIARELIETRQWPKDRVPVIWPCGRPAAELPPVSDHPKIRKARRAELGIDDEAVVILTAARMHPQKRPLDLVRLAERVRDLENTHFLVVGGGDLEGGIDREIAGQPDLNIRRLAFRTDIPDLIVAADAGCLVSDFEGLPVFMLECLQLGRPFLGTRVGDLGRVLDETGAGIVVDQPGDLDALEAAVRRISSPEIRSGLAEHAMRAAPRFSVEQCADAYAAAFLGTG